MAIYRLLQNVNFQFIPCIATEWWTLECVLDTTLLWSHFLCSERCSPDKKWFYRIIFPSFLRSELPGTMKWSILSFIMMEESSMSPEWSKQLWKADTHALVLSLNLRNLWSHQENFAEDHSSSVIQIRKSVRASKRSEVICCVVRDWKRRWGEFTVTWACPGAFGLGFGAVKWREVGPSGPARSSALGSFIVY